MQQADLQSKSILCLGMGWFPQSPGGLNRYVYELIQSLTSQHTLVEYCGIDIPKTSSVSGLQLTNLASGDRSLPQRLWSVHQQFAQRQFMRPDAINLHFSLYSLPILRQLPADVPVTFTFHGPWALESQQEGASQMAVNLKHWVERQVFQRCDRFIVLSKAFGKILHEQYAIPWEQIHIIPGGVDTQHFQANLTRQQAREKLGWSRDRFILFTPRRLVHRMGLDKLLTAVAEVRQSYPDIWLAIAGKGPLKDDLARQISELELRQHAQLLGFVPDADLPIAYQAADVTIMPSQSLEGFGLVLVESLACGTPAVCTPIGGMPDVIGNLSPQLITADREASTIAQMLKDILAVQVPLPTREACRDYAKQHFEWAAIAPQVRQILLA